MTDAITATGALPAATVTAATVTVVEQVTEEEVGHKVKAPRIHIVSCAACREGAMGAE